MESGTWYNLGNLNNKRFTCGYCGEQVSSEKAYYTHNPSYGKIYICHACNRPTYFNVDGNQTPGALLGGKIDHLPEDIEKLYGEIRRSTATASYTAAVLASRKLLMHIAVESGAETGKLFVDYVNYLVDNGYTPPNSQTWIDKIRTAGNEANHEIVIMGEQDAKDIIKLIEMLLKFNYEFPAEAEE
jgi:hypothetical protein